MIISPIPWLLVDTLGLFQYLIRLTSDWETVSTHIVAWGLCKILRYNVLSNIVPTQFLVSPLVEVMACCLMH